jgi:oligopeptide/dipeptide ABC transporter ATP-binding protein
VKKKDTAGKQINLEWRIGDFGSEPVDYNFVNLPAVNFDKKEWRMQPILQVKNLVTRFYSVDGVVHALNGVNFELYEGETLAVVGESGSGKSVTMMSIIGLIPKPPGKIEGGEALFEENGTVKDLLKMSDDEIRLVRGGKMGFIFQDPISSLNPTMTIGRQIAESMQQHLGLNRTEARLRTIKLLRQVGIPDAERRYDSYPHAFSGGMRQRVMIAIAVACEPSIVIADEPTTALDVTVQAQTVDLVKRLQETLGVAVIWITHDLGVVAGIADRVLVMYGGTIVENARVDELYDNPQHPYTKGLLKAIPRVDESGEAESEALASIEGTPPDLLQPLICCPFAPRCGYAFARCWQAVPQLISVGDSNGDGHQAACFYDMTNNRPREDSIG